MGLLTIKHPARGYARGRWKKRDRPPAAVVVHTTGAGPVRRVTEAKFDRWRRRHGVPKGRSFEAALAVYGHVMDAGPHFVVGQGGELEQVAPLGYAAWHVGSRNLWRYKWWHVHHPKTHAWWVARHPAFESPLEWPVWETRSVNERTVGVEVVPPIGDVSGPWSDAALEAVGWIVQQVGLPVTTHADVHPLARVRNGKPWDPRPMPIAQLDERFGVYSRRSVIPRRA